MCGRYTIYADAEFIKKEFNLNQLNLDFYHYNIAPTSVQPVICELPGNLRALCMMKWDLTPSWQNSKKAPLINARVESLNENKPFFRQAIRHRRCLVITSGFYEWKTVNSLNQPYFITLKSNKPFAFAGIWERNVNQDPMDSFAIITVPANEAVEPFHTRMPAILPNNDYAAWLDPTARDWEAVKHLVKPYPAEELSIFPVTRKMNNTRYTESDSVIPITNDGITTK
jgi:putative SOS response-associated peptidase YedK